MGSPNWQTPLSTSRPVLTLREKSHIQCRQCSDERSDTWSQRISARSRQLFGIKLSSEIHGSVVQCGLWWQLEEGRDNFWLLSSFLPPRFSHCGSPSHAKASR